VSVVCVCAVSESACAWVGGRVSAYMCMCVYTSKCLTGNRLTPYTVLFCMVFHVSQIEESMTGVLSATAECFNILLVARLCIS